MQYRTRLPIAALTLTDGHPMVVTVAAGKRINSVTCTADERFVVVDMDGARFQLFEADFRERCTADSTLDYQATL